MKKALARLIIVIPAVFIQVMWYIFTLRRLEGIATTVVRDVVSVLLMITAVLFVLYLISKRDEPSYKILWIIIILIAPITGVIMYITMGNRKTGRRLGRRLKKASSIVPEGFGESDCFDELEREDLRTGQTVRRLGKITGAPLTACGDTRYYPFGEDMFPDLCEDIRNAEKYVYLEYFIIQEGKFWNTLTDILAEKAEQGVDVRVIYDDIGSITTYSPMDVSKLVKRGIRFTVFNPFIFILTQLNNRDHRKMTVIDGKIAYSGGLNLADEYINEKERFGIWKDIGFRLTGDGVKSYVYMFAEFWNAFSAQKIDASVLEYGAEEEAEERNGMILSYYDSPVRSEHASNELYVEMLSSATKYIWFYTPYLILGDALFNAMIRAARRGVDVRIFMPGIPDKKIIYRLSRSYYRDLAEAGVRIFEYTPGFLHAKACICDGKVATIGTVNLDYRSLFLHFECNSLFYGSDIIRELKQDMEKTRSECTERTPETINRSLGYRLIDGVLRVLAPLL